MPRKRKASFSTEVAQVEIQPKSDHIDVKLRRSTRRIIAAGDACKDPSDAKSSYQAETESESCKETQHRTQGEGIGLLGPKEDSGAGSDSKEVEDKEAMARKGVRDAIAGLARMERNLIQATKRQQEKVKESDFTTVRPDYAEEQAFKPEPTMPIDLAHDGRRGRPHPTTGEHLPTPERESAASEAEEEEGSLMDGTRVTRSGDVGAEDSGAARSPAVNSDYLPLPWKGRLGYACLNTYLRGSNPPVFSSRTCRMASIIDHRHPLRDPSQPEHPIKNRPDRTVKADKGLGLKFLQELGLANARDIVKMLRWNDKYGIKFMRLSSEMFPFASHEEHGYRLEPFASTVLAEAGKAAAELGHRLTMHPGQFTQLGSPRKEVVSAAVRDLEYHDELLTLLQLPEQQNRDAVLILHMGGVYGDKTATLDRFRQNYTNLLRPSIKSRLVLENDDVSWSVHDLLPICEELNIPLVLDFHHNNIIFDSTQLREGTFDISQPAIMQRIAATWTRKRIKQKMHYSEPCTGAVTPRDRRKHSPRVATLPPCPPDMDLMIEAKDKEQAVFELMRTFKLPGYEKINDVIPYARDDVQPPPALYKSKKGTGTKKRKREESGTAESEKVFSDVETAAGTDLVISLEELGMGGPENRVYWPPGMEGWLKPRKRAARGPKAGYNG